MFVFVFLPVYRAEEMMIDHKPDYFKFTIRQSHFDKVYEKLRLEEGNYVWDKNDFGEETYGGITRKFCPKWIGWKYIDTAKKLNKKVVRHTLILEAEPHVKNLYHTWWINWGMDVIQDSLAASYTFDLAICGASSVKVIQRTLNMFGHNFKINGRMIPEMANSINKLDPIIYIETLRLERRDFYLSISQKYHRVKDKSGKWKRDKNGNFIKAQTQKVFLKGWLIRADRIRPLIKKRLMINETIKYKGV